MILSILIAGLVTGLILRYRYLKMPLDWDHGLLLYQAYWWWKTKRFVSSWIEIEVHPLNIPDKCAFRTQKLAHSLIYLVMYKICKDRVWAYRAFDAIYFLLISVIVYFWAARLFNPLIASLAAALFFYFSAMPFWWVADDNPEKFQLLFMVLGYYCVSCGLFIPAGVCFFIAMLFKQNAALVIIALIGFLNIDAVSMVATMTILYAITFAFYIIVHKLTFTQIFRQLLFSKYLGRYIKSQNNYYILKTTMKMLLYESGPLLVAGVIGLVMCGTPVLWVIFAGCMACLFMSNKFFPYYFIPFLPVLAVCGAWLIFNVEYSIIVMGGLFVISSTFTFKFFITTSSQQAFYTYQNTLCNFVNSEYIGKYIRERTDPEDYIYIHTLNPEIYFYSQRRSPIITCYLDHMTWGHYPDAEKVEITNLIRAKLTKTKPKYIILSDRNIDLYDFIGVKYKREAQILGGYSGKKLVILFLFRRVD